MNILGKITFEGVETNPEVVPPDSVARYIDTRKAAAYLGLAPETLERWRSLRIGPPYISLSRRALRYDRNDLDRFMGGEMHQSGLGPAKIYPGGRENGK